MALFFYIGYFVVGIAQFFAIWDGLNIYLGWGFLDFIIACLLTYIPLVGSILGVMGAMDAWHWNFWQAMSLFFWWVPVGGLMLLAGAFASRR